MRWYHYLILGLLGLIISFSVSAFQSSPGYMDADYYYSSGKQLAEGHGFNEMILWNYLDNPAGLPHPSHAYWMPMASIVAAAGMWLTNSISFSSGRLFFFCMAAVIPPLTAYLGLSITNRFAYALTAGFLAIFSGYYFPYSSITDTFSIYMLLGIGFLLVLGYGMKNQGRTSRSVAATGLGVIAGLAHLSRADGILWLVVASVAVLMLEIPSKKRYLFPLSLVFCGYLLVMGSWFLRNILVFATPLAPGGNHALWLTSYDEIYSFPAGKLTYNFWLESGNIDILSKRFDALIWNLKTAWAVQGLVFLLPFVVLGLWLYRHDLRIRIGIISWAGTFLLMTFIFPFAGSRGGFFHSGAALQPLWWVMAPVGIEKAVIWVETKRKWRKGEASKVFTVGSVVICIMISGLIFAQKVLLSPGWGYEAERYKKIESLIGISDPSKKDVVVVGNPPGYFNVSSRPSIAVPNESLDVLMVVAAKFGARYLILEDDGTPAPLREVFTNPEAYPILHYLGDIDGAKIFALP